MIMMLVIQVHDSLGRDGGPGRGHPYITLTVGQSGEFSQGLGPSIGGPRIIPGPPIRSVPSQTRPTPPREDARAAPGRARRSAVPAAVPARDRPPTGYVVSAGRPARQSRRRPQPPHRRPRPRLRGCERNGFGIPDCGFRNCKPLKQKVLHPFGIRHLSSGIDCFTASPGAGFRRSGSPDRSVHRLAARPTRLQD
jgi:hypothetical protein